MTPRVSVPALTCENNRQRSAVSPCIWAKSIWKLQ